MICRNRNYLGLTAYAAALVPTLSLGATSASAQMLNSYFTPIPHTEDTGTSDTSKADTLSRYAAPGVRVGTFLVYPQLSESVGYDSNVDGQAGGHGSPTVRTSGSVSTASNWSRDSLTVVATVDDHRFLDQPRQNYTDWTTNIAGSIDVGHDSITAGYLHSTANQLPGSINTVTFFQPVPLQIDTARVGYVATQRGRFTIIPELRVTHYASDDFIAGGTTISQAYRDRIALQPGITVRYQLAPQRDLVFVVQGTHLDYRTSSPGLPKRNSNGVAVLGGIDYPAPTTNLRVRALVGVQTRQFDSSAYANITAPTLEVAATWTPTRLTTVTLTGQREIDDAANESIAGYTQTTFRLNVDHELRRNVTLRGYAEMQRAEYESSRISTPVVTVDTAGRTQTLFDFGVGATWQLNRNVGLRLDYEIATRQGSTASSHYTSNTGLLTLDLRL